MRLVMLGSSAGTPTRGRNVSATALLPAGGRGWCLVDCGEGTQHQLLRTPLSLHALDAVFITHVHGDHCFGLPGLLGSAGMGGRSRPLRLVGPAAVWPWLQATLQMSHSWLPFEVQFEAVETFSGGTVGEWAVSTVALSHRVPSWAYVFTEACPEPRLNTQRLAAEGVPRGPLWGELAHGRAAAWQGRTLHARDYRLAGRAPVKVLICGDNDTPELLRAAAEGASLLVHEATYSEAVRSAGKQGYGHSSALAVAQFGERAGVANLLLTHFSPRYQRQPGRGPWLGELAAEAAAVYSGNLLLAEDLAEYQLGRDGRVHCTPPAPSSP